MKKNILFLAFVVFALHINAQDYRIGIVNHNLSHPGLSVAKGFSLAHRVTTKTKKNKIKDISKTNIFLPQFTYYNVIRTENSFSLGTEILRQRKRLNPTAWWFETGIGFHYVRSFNAGKTFEIENNEVSRIRFAGTNYFAPSISYSIGKSFELGSLPRLMNVYLKPQVFFLMPYNATVVPSVNIQLGFKYPLIHIIND